MNSDSRLLHFAEALMSTPTAPFREQWAVATLDRLLAEIPKLQCSSDMWGNRYATLGSVDRESPPLVFVAHLDHPGFVFSPRASTDARRRITGVFEGRVEDHFFLGAPVRLFRSADDAGVAGVIREVSLRGGPDDNRHVEIEAAESAEDVVLGMWDVPAFECDGASLCGRVCDDLVGVASTLSALDRLSRLGGDHVPVVGLFTRAEEAGFLGALQALETEQGRALLPPGSQVISVEISSARPTTPLGGGAVIRVGDRAMCFNPEMVARLWNSTERARSRGTLAVQRALMDGGTCEATAFAWRGYDAAGVCAPVQNYHNMDFQTDRIGMERVALSDVSGVEETLVLSATGFRCGSDPMPRLDALMQPLAERARLRLEPLDGPRRQTVAKGARP